ncbi:MAG: hypothetical protein PF437_01335 [Sulfurimonas sp.]|jgi:uncharacterized protein YicC (UPF0701 family)|nr:hypothetical protein [Sulfurimonas sp.]
MNDRELYQQEKQAILDDYEEELKELKEMASASGTDAKNGLDKQIKTVELKIQDAKAKLEAVGKASEEEISAHKKAIDDTFKSIYTSLAMS